MTSHNYGLDLARILAIGLVLLVHITLFGTGNWRNSSILWGGVASFSYCCVDLFALLSGYLGINSRWRAIKFFALWVQVVFTGVVTLFVAHFVFGVNASLKEFISAFLPILTDQYWYFTAYSVVFLMMPILNVGVRSMTGTQVTMFLVFLLAFVIGNTLFPSHDNFVLNSGYSAFWLVLLYVIGAILRLRVPRCLENTRPMIWFFIAFIASALTWAQYLSVQRIPLVSTIFRGQATLLTYTSPTVLLCAICLLMGCANLKIENRYLRAILAFFAPTAFGVFLIHSQPVIRRQCWPNIMPWISNLPIGLDVLVLLVIVAIIYISCAFAERIRMSLFSSVTRITAWVFQK